MNRIDRLLFNLNIKGMGLEIGPSHSPIAPKSNGFNIHILDHANADELRDKYRRLGISEDKLDNIEEVDFIWRGEPLSAVVQNFDFYDYILASHVVEHTPDLISFLRECELMLKPGGILSLAVPDKRCCFDILRSISTLGEVLQANHEGRVRHTPGTIFNHFSMVAFRNNCHTWDRFDNSELKFVHTLTEAIEMFNLSITSEDYIDVHNWIFTPESFRLMISDLKLIGKTNLSEYTFFDTDGFEFIIQMKKSDIEYSIDRMKLAQEAQKL
jgi:predicted SAM-dependent methyltransferase